MNVREFMNDNPQYVYIGAGVLFFFSMMLVMCQLFGGGGGASDYEVFYYDTEKKTIRIVEFSAGDIALSPLEDEPNVYQAMLYACGECDSGAIHDGMTIAEVEAAGMTVRYITKFEQGEGEGADAFEGGQMFFSPPDRIDWKPDYEATEVDDCPDARPCFPN